MSGSMVLNKMAEVRQGLMGFFLFGQAKAVAGRDPCFVHTFLLAHELA
jgi:hypothetical protein